MFDPIIESPIALALACGLFAVLLVFAGHRASCMTRLSIPAAIPAKLSRRSFGRAAMIVFILLFNAASLGVQHRFPFGIDLMATGFLVLLFMPRDEASASM
jgi:hypothetical protein